MSLTDEDYFLQRQQMVSSQIESRGIHDPSVLNAMRQVPRHYFVPEHYRQESYQDYPIPIADGQTISQPYIVAYMTSQLVLKGDEVVLEVGTGSGYQAAILSRLCSQVVTLERFAGLADQAGQVLAGLGYKNVDIQVGDGSLGWPAEAPYQGILVTAAAPEVPPALLQQLAEGGRLIIPAGPRSFQRLQLWTRLGGNFHCQELLAVSFVPLRGQGGWKNEQWGNE